MKQPCVYILASRKHGTLYVGVSSNLVQRIYQHRVGAMPGFSSVHEVKQLVWFEMHETMESAILREKRIKKWNRDWKIRLIEEENPDWLDLATSIGFEPLAMQDKKPFRHSREGGNPCLFIERPHVSQSSLSSHLHPDVQPAQYRGV
jgi:putative endonuclease